MVNGLYIPFIFFTHYFLYRHFFLSIAISLKIYSSNYFFWFNDDYSYKGLPRRLNWIKQFVRFTDTGHIISFLYCTYPTILPIAFNTHFIITFAYWIGHFFFQMKDCDIIQNAITIPFIDNTFNIFNHLLPLILLTFELWKHPELAIFDYTSLFYSYLWIVTWFCFIYIPWRSYTGDCVYNILHATVHYSKIFTFVMVISGLYIASNTCGYYLTNII